MYEAVQAAPCEEWVLIHSMNGVKKLVKRFFDLSQAYIELQTVQGKLCEEGNHVIFIRNSISDEILIERVLIIE